MLEEGIEFALAPKTQIEALPPVAEDKNGPLSWRVEWVKSDEGKLKARLETRLTKGELSREETVAFQRQLQRLLAALSTGVILRIDH